MAEGDRDKEENGGGRLNIHVRRQLHATLDMSRRPTSGGGSRSCLNVRGRSRYQTTRRCARECVPQKTCPNAQKMHGRLDAKSIR